LTLKGFTAPRTKGAEDREDAKEETLATDFTQIKHKEKQRKNITS